MSKKNKKHMKQTKGETPIDPKEDVKQTVENNEVKQEVPQTEETAEQKPTTEPGDATSTEQAEQPSAPGEEVNDDAQAEGSATEEEKLLKALAEAEEKFNDLHDKYLRQMAEFENYRKRTLKEKSELVLNGSAHLMTAVLPILDDMDRAMDAMAKTEDAASCREGFGLIANKFRVTLEQNGLKKIETEGQTFDTDFHEAIAMVPATEEIKQGQVVDCVQKGYKLNDKVIRHAKVVVAN